MQSDHWSKMISNFSLLPLVLTILLWLTESVLGLSKWSQARSLLLLLTYTVFSRIPSILLYTVSRWLPLQGTASFSLHFYCGNVGWLILVTVKNATRDTIVQKSLWDHDFVSFRFMSRNRVWDHMVVLYLKIFEEFLMVFSVRCIILDSQQVCKGSSTRFWNFHLKNLQKYSMQSWAISKPSSLCLKSIAVENKQRLSSSLS